MVLSDENIKEFQEICKEHLGIEISKEDARENGTKLLRLISLIYRPKDQEKSEVVESRAETLIEQKVEKSNESN